jgi:hypothetical protein
MKLENWIKGMKSRRFIERLISREINLDKDSPGS